MGENFDVAILGGGPAGSLTAALLRRQAPHKRVLVLERDHFPRPHVGEVTLPGWAPILRRAGVLEKIDAAMPIKKVGVTFAWGPAEAGRTWSADFREPDGAPLPSAWLLQRDVFDELLLRHAQELGARVIEGARVRTVEPLAGEPPPGEARDPAGFRVTWDGGECVAQHIVDASGQARLLTRLFDLPLHRFDDMNNYALHGYWRGGGKFQNHHLRSDPERWAFIATSDDGWIWHVPIDHDVASVGLVTRKEVLRETGRAHAVELYHRNIEGSEVGPLLADAGFLGSTRLADDRRVNVVADWAYRVDRVAGPGWFLVGDAALFVDPVLSSGLTLVAHGASMVANALCTLWDGGDGDLLRRSYQESYQDLAGTYHRMAKVWYSRNLRRDSWFWAARREQLRGGGLWETDGDAFAALSVGAVTNPLEGALVEGHHDLWGVEFFSWITARNLFADGEEVAFDGVDDAGAARQAASRKMLDRWRQLSGSRLRVLRDDWQEREGYWTSMFVDRWSWLRFVELPGEQRDVYPAFTQAPSGIFPWLDGSRTGRAAVCEALAGVPETPEQRDRRAQALAESILRLDALGLLEAEGGDAALPGGEHPWLRVLLGSVLAALREPARVEARLGWLGEDCRVALRLPDGTAHLSCVNVRLAPNAPLKSATTAISWASPPGREDWTRAVCERLRRRLLRHEQRGAPDLWEACRHLGGFGVAVDFAPGQRVRLDRL